MTRAATKAETKKKARPEGPALPANCEALMSRADVAAALRVSVRHLDGMVAAAEYPAAEVHLGRAPRWRRTTHDAWVRKACGARAES